MTVQAVVIGQVEIAGAGDGPAEISFPGASWALPSGAAVGVPTTIGSGGTPQNLAPARSERKGWFLINLSTGYLWVDDTNNPVVNACIPVPPGKMFVCPSAMVTTGVLKVLGATAGQLFVFREAF